MSALFPKYHELICNTYTPVFVAGPSPCTLQSGDTTRSRLADGGTLFRSVENGSTSNVNNIILECIVTPTIGNVQEVVFKITDPLGAVTTLPTFTQEYDALAAPDPICFESGISQLRATLATNLVVTMPTIDDIQPWDAITDDSECLLTSFGPTNLSGAAVLPDNISPIRTGPAFTLYHVGSAEESATGLPLTVVNTLSEWDGTQWIAHPSTLYDPDSPPPCP